MRNVLKRLLGGFLGLWALVSALAFLLAALIPTWPSDWELPWSGVTDFAMLPDATLLVYVRDYDRILKYSIDGVFFGSVPGAGYRAGRGKLVTTADGRIIVEHMGRMVQLSSNGEVLPRAAGHDRHLAWVLDENGNLIQNGLSDRDSIQPVGEGELVFGGMTARPRDTFRVGELLARRQGRCIQIERNSGDDSAICAPLYFLSITGFWPAAAPIFILVVWWNIDVLRRRWSASKRRTD